jgi:hypothetical protein
MADLRSNQERMAAWGAGAAPATTMQQLSIQAPQQTKGVSGWDTPAPQGNVKIKPDNYNKWAEEDAAKNKRLEGIYQDINDLNGKPGGRRKPMLPQSGTINSMGINTAPNPEVERYQNQRDAGLMRQPDWMKTPTTPNSGFGKSTNSIANSADPTIQAWGKAMTPSPTTAPAAQPINQNDVDSVIGQNRNPNSYSNASPIMNSIKRRFGNNNIPTAQTAAKPFQDRDRSIQSPLAHWMRNRFV